MRISISAILPMPVKAMLELNFTPFPVLTTDRLILRSLEPGDDQDIYAHRCDDKVNTYLEGFRHASIGETRAFISRVLGEITDMRTILWVLSRRDNHQFMGTVCLWNISKEEHKAELGYTICTEHQGQGYMGEAVKKALDFGFHTMKLQTIEAFTHKENRASIRLLTKNSFKLIMENAPDKKDRVMFSLERE